MEKLFIKRNNSIAPFYNELNLKPINMDFSNENVEQTDKIKAQNKRIILNVRGIKYECLLNTFNKYPTSRLGKLFNLLSLNSNQANIHNDLINLCDDYDLNKMEFYFNKDPFILNMILNLFEYDNNENRLHLNENTCYSYLNEQLNYWLIDYELTICKCCKMHLSMKTDLIETELRKEELLLEQIEFRHDFGKRFYPHLREKLFNYMEKPNESIIGKIYLIIMTLFVVTTIIILIIATINGIIIDPITTKIFESLIITVFTIDIILRFISYPSPLVYFKIPLNWIELCTLIIFYVNVVTPVFQYKDKLNVISRCLRAFSILRVTKHITGIQTLIDTFRNSIKEISLYFFYLGIGVLISSCICYAFEYAETDTKFTSIPATFWWSLITMTTVN